MLFKEKIDQVVLILTNTLAQLGTLLFKNTDTDISTDDSTSLNPDLQTMSISKTISDATTTVRESMKSALNMGINMGTGGGVKDIGTLHYEDLMPWNESGQKETQEFYQRLTTILIDFIEKSNDRSQKVLDFHHPDQMLEVMDLSLPDDPQNLDQLLTDCKDTLKYQVKTGHPHFFNQLSNGLDTMSLAGEWLTATANTNMFTYEIAPVFIMMESFVLKKMREIIGFPRGDSILAPGGSISNLYAIIVARHRMFPDYKKNGLRSLPTGLVMFTSELCHYSIKSAAMVTGLGTDNCVEVPTDEKGRMIPSELERLVQKALADGKAPYFVNCTSGTTVFGAFDPINEIADICEKYKMWLHIDGAWGASVLMSKKYRSPRFDGVERVDSISWNPHKLLTTVLQCSTIHFKESGVLTSCNQMYADYLFQQDKHYDVRFDTGDKVIQCGRHNDIFKFWLQWRAKGTSGLEKHVDTLMELTEYMVARMRTMPDKFYIIVPDPEFVNICFWYVPIRLRSMAHGAERAKLLAEVTPKIKAKMMESGTMMIGYQPQKEIPNFFRHVISNPAVKKGDVDFVLAELDRLGQDL